MHLPGCDWLVRKELEALLADEDIELLFFVDRKRACAPLAPVNIGSNGSRDCKHLRAEVNSHDPPCTCKPGVRDARDDTSTASNVEKTISALQRRSINEYLCPRFKERFDQQAFVQINDPEGNTVYSTTLALSDGAVYRVFRDRDTDAWFIDAIVD